MTSHRPLSGAVRKRPAMTRALDRRPLTGRDPHEPHRTATPLELLFDLTFVVAFGQAADEMAHYLAVGHTATAIGGFCIATFAVSWAWIHYSWFASAYDEDDWVCRLSTMVQMVGVVILALGLPELFESLDEGSKLDSTVMVAGYVVMRIPMVFQWLRVSRDDPANRRAARTYACTLAISLAGWIGLIFLHLPIAATTATGLGLITIDLSGPVIAERRGGRTPWHAHHIAERYGLLVIITLGEAIIGTVASISVLTQEDTGWSTGAVLIAIAGIGLTFAMWWLYFSVPWGDLIHLRRARSYVWSYAHIPIFGGLAAMGAGLHVAAYFLETDATYNIGAVFTVLSVATPVALVGVFVFGAHAWMRRDGYPFLTGLTCGMASLLVLSVVLADAGVSMPICLLVIMMVAVVTVAAYEVFGRTRLAESAFRAGYGPTSAN